MNQADRWRPTTSHAALVLRAESLARLRSFFAAQGVLEVDTPLLSAAATTDPQLESFQTRLVGPGVTEGRTLYLNTSPEFAMKRLLAAGSGPIYQVCKAFRQGEIGRLHNPEFTLVEWYRPGFDHFQLMDEVAALVMDIAADRLSLGPTERVEYGQIFRDLLDIDPHVASVMELRDCAARRINIGATLTLDRDGWLDLLMSHCIQPQLGKGRLSFVYHYPASQAALARVRKGEPAVAERFELFLNGVELANGFHELADSDLQRARFKADLETRRRHDLIPVPIDELLLDALTNGLPDCAGVALGLDRLLLAMTGVEKLSEVVSFTVERS